MTKLIFNVSCPFSRDENMSLCFTVEKLNDVSEVHVVLQDDVPVDLHQRQGDEEDKVTRGDTLGGPDGFPDCEHVIVHQLWKKNKNKARTKPSKCLRARMKGGCSYQREIRVEAGVCWGGGEEILRYQGEKTTTVHS